MKKTYLYNELKGSKSYQKNRYYKKEPDGNPGAVKHFM